MKWINEVNKYNLVNEKTKVEPNYELSERETSIKVYIDLRGNLIIIGVVDNNYIYWASHTNTNDSELNEKIFKHISNGDYNMVSHEYKALESINIEYKELRRWFCSELIRETKHNMVWKTPFGHYYGADQIDNNGRYFANDISNYLASLQRMCRFRECNGEYALILKSYLRDLTNNDDFQYYEVVKPLITILKNEDYLILSEDKEIRELYFECMECCSDLYNRYMTAVR